MNYKLYVIETKMIIDGRRPKHYVWGITKRHAKKRFRSLFPHVRVYNAVLCDDVNHALFVITHPSKFIII